MTLVRSSPCTLDVDARHRPEPPAARAGPSRVVVERVSSSARFHALEAPWRALEERAALTTPFTTFDWASAWWGHLRESRFGVRDRLDFRALWSADGDLVGVAPLITTLRPGRTPIAFRQLHYLGPDPNITELRSALGRPQDLRLAYADLLDDLQATANSWDFLTLGCVPEEVDIEGALRSRFTNVVVGREIPSFHVKLAPTWEAFKAGLGRNIKESIRRCVNAPKRDGIDLRFETVTERGEVTSAIDEFLRLHRARADWDDGVRHRNVFETPGSRRFLVDVCERFAERGAFRLFRLRAAGKVVAARIGFVLGDSLYLYYSGFEPALARYSVMTTVVVEAIQYAIREGFRTVSLSTGRDESKLRWSPVETVHRELTVVSPSFRGWLGYEASSRARSWMARLGADGPIARRSSLARRIAEALGRRAV
jgi:CelD/BcsL family acetyltransferase involved in cellulose biosynthesis